MSAGIDGYGAVSMDVPLALIILGGVLVILGIAGGGIKTKWVEVPFRIGRGLRVASGAFGVLCVAAGALLFLYEGRAPERRPGNAIIKTESAEKAADVSGRVVDIFSNPRSEVVILARGVQRYALSDERGRFVLMSVPRLGSYTLDAYFGSERDSVTFAVSPGEAGTALECPDPLILNPIEIDAVLCGSVEHVEGEGLKPFGVFEGDNPRVPLESLLPADLEKGEEPASGRGDSREIWCFLRIYGPLKYEIGRETVLFYEWYLGGELTGAPYRQTVGVRPSGWRTRASKKVWKGEWLLKVRSVNTELVRIAFEVN